MDVDLGDFKGLFNLRTVFGTSTVSLSTLEQSKWKITYTVGLLTVYASETVVYCIENTDRPILLKVMKILGASLPVYSLITAMVDYKSCISVALNLKAIENKLEKMDMPISGKTTFLALSKGWFLFSTVIMGLSIMGHIEDNRLFLPMTRYVTAIHLAGIQVIECTLLMMFLTKSAMIQKAVTKGFSKLFQQEEQPNSQRPLSRQRINRIVQPAVADILSSLKELQGSLETTGNMICNNFWVHTIWFRLSLEVLVPVVSSLWGFSGPGTFALIRGALQFLGVVLTWESLKKEKEVSFTTLCDFHQNGERNHVKRQLLAKIHRSQVPFSCGLFDVNYGLLAVVIENVFFVVTALIGNKKNTV